MYWWSHWFQLLLPGMLMQVNVPQTNTVVLALRLASSTKVTHQNQISGYWLITSLFRPMSAVMLIYQTGNFTRTLTLLFQLMLWWYHNANTMGKNEGDIMLIIYICHAPKSDKPLLIDIPFCFPSLKTIHERSIMLSQKANIPIFHIYAIYRISFWVYMRDVGTYLCHILIH